MSQVQVSKYVKFIERPNDTVIYHSQIGGACAIDEKIREIFEKLKDIKVCNSPQELISKLKFNIDESELEEVFQEFSEKGFLIVDGVDTDYVEKYTNERIQNLSTGRQIKTIQLVVSNNCNFKCKYCFENKIYCSEEREKYQHDINNKIMSSADAIEYIQVVIDTIKKEDADALHIQFFGGEPLTNKEAIIAVLEHFENGKQYGIDISYSIVTNGSLIDKNIAEYFKRYNVGVVISFDNPKKTDRNMKSGKNSIEKVIESLEILKSNNNHVAFNSVLSQQTIEYFDTSIIDCALEYNVSEVGIVLDLDPSFYTKDTIEEISDKLIEVYQYGLEKDIQVSGYWMSTYLASLDFMAMKKGFKTCSGTGSQFSIEPNGKVFSCKGSSAYFGDIRDIKELLSNETYQLYAKRSINNSSKCKACDIEGFCSGFCLGPLEQSFGSANYVLEEYCELLKSVTQRLFAIEGDLDYYEL